MHPGAMTSDVTTVPSDAPRPPRRGLSARARWAVPVAVGAVVVAGFAAAPLLADAGSAGLPDITAQQLVTKVLEAKPVPMSGTVVYTARLGLPDISSLGAVSGTVSPADPINLLSGSSTLRMWTDGAGRSRVSLLGATSEYSVVHDTTQAWTYSSKKDAVTHYTLSAADAAKLKAEQQNHAQTPVPGASELPTPSQAADQALSQAQQYSTVTLDSQTTVAGRGAYQLVVTPKTSGTLVAHIVVTVDAATYTPLRVQVWSTDNAKAPALEVGFTDVSFAKPSDAVLSFSAPPGAKVTDKTITLPQHTDATKPTPSPTAGALPQNVTLTGTGWASVVEVRGVNVSALLAGNAAAAAAAARDLPHPPTAQGQDVVSQFMGGDGTDPSKAGSGLSASTLYDGLTKAVPGGRLLSSALVSVLILDDGRVLAGAVPGATLQQLAG